MQSKLENQKEKVSDVLPESGKSQEGYLNSQAKEHHSENIKPVSRPVERLINRNLDAKKMLADELCEMGLSVEEILRILRF